MVAEFNSHLARCREIYLSLVDKARSWDKKLEKQLVDARDYAALELAIMKHLMRVK